MTQISKSLKYPVDLICLLIIASIPRLLLLFSSNAGIESDEAIVGLMAKHISEGKSFPIFYYGQPYMGSLEAILVAPLFFLFGVNNYCLKIVPFLFSLGHVVLTYLIGTRLRNISTGRMAALYAALAPSSLIIWSLKARGGFIETIFLGSLALLISLEIFKPKATKFKNFAYLGLVLGLGWWTNNQIIFFIAPIGLSLIYLFLKERAYTLKEVVSIFFIGVSSFILGGLPFWIYNLNEKPKWKSFELLFGQTAGNSSLTYFYDYWATALPIILGAKKFWSDSETYSYACFAIYLLFFVLFALGYRNRERGTRISAIPFYVFLFTTPVIFSLSSFGWLSRAPRYLLPLYSVLPVLIGYHLSLISNSILKRIGLGLFALIFTHNLASNYLDGEIADEGQPMVYQGGRVSSDHTELYSWLRANGCSHIHTNYWIGYRTALETKEEITFTRFGTPRSLRLPDYEKDEESRPNSCGLTLVLAEAEVNGVKNWLKAEGKIFKEAKASNYTIIYGIEYEYFKGPKLEIKMTPRVFIPPDNSTLSELTKNTSSLFDGSIDTRWGSGQAQKAGMAVEIDFEKPVDLGSLSIRLGNFKHDAPSSLVISAYTGGSDRVFLFDMRETRAQSDIQMREFSDLEDTWDIRFEPIKTSKLRLELMEENPIFDWSIAELEFYGPSALEDTHK